MAKVLNYKVVIEKDEDGVFVVSVPSIQGCYSEGNTFEEAMKNIKDVIKLHLKSRRDVVDLTTEKDTTEFLGITNVSINYGIPSNS